MVLLPGDQARHVCVSKAKGTGMSLWAKPAALELEAP